MEPTGCVLAAWILSVAAQVSVLAGSFKGVIGVHAWEISIDEYGLYSRLILAGAVIYSPCMACAKTALCLFYGRLDPSVIYQIAIKVTLFIIVGAYTSVFFSLLFACRPVAASWDPMLLPTAQCLNQGAIYITTAVVGIATDVLLLALPIPRLWKLQMPAKQKIGLTIMFGIGSMCVFHLLLFTKNLLELGNRRYRLADMQTEPWSHRLLDLSFSYPR